MNVKVLTHTQVSQLQAFNDCFIEHTQVRKIYDDFDSLRTDRLFQSDPKCMLLTGDTGVGKSHLIRHYKLKVLAEQIENPEKVPVLITRISNTKGLPHTLMQILSDLSLFGSHRRSLKTSDKDLTKQVVNNLKRAQVELLILNEAQELIEFKTPKERQNIANTLKYISEEARVSIVLVGMPWAEQLADEPQWSSRLTRRRTLEYFSLTKARKYYLQYLKALNCQLPIDAKLKLYDPHTSIALFSVCRGENRALKGLIMEALKVCFYQEKSMLDKKCFADAYTNIYGSINTDNPFLQDIHNIKISEVVRDSSYNPNAMSEYDMLSSRVFSEPTVFRQLQFAEQ